MNSHDAGPELPRLESGLNLLERDARSTEALHSLVLDHVLLSSGEAVWVDARGQGSTRPMADLAPSMRVLDRIHIARGFTPWQHLSLVEDLRDAVDDDTELLVLPEIDAPYRTDDLSGGERRRLFERVLTHVERLVDDLDVPVLVTRAADDCLTRGLDKADTVFWCEQTRFGPRFASDEFETLVYRLGGGVVQTTIAFWNEVLARRHPAHFDVVADAGERSGVTVEMEVADGPN